MILFSKSGSPEFPFYGPINLVEFRQYRNLGRKPLTPKFFEPRLFFGKFFSHSVRTSFAERQLFTYGVEDLCDIDMLI